MSVFRTLIVFTLLTLSCTGTALAEGFAMTEWSARGLALASGMVGRADDVSTLAYNAAGITQLPGMHLMAGMSFIMPCGTISTEDPYGTHNTTDAERKTWAAPHAYLSYQLNDSVWLGVGMFSRFGLGNTYDENWVGRYNVYDVGMQSFSVVPTVAYKFNDMFSASVGVEVMYMTMTQGTKVPMFDVTSPTFVSDNDIRLQGSGTGVGVHLGVHAKFNEQWSAGLTYKSQVVQHITGTAEFAYQATDSIVSPITNMHDSDVEGTIVLPDSVAFGIAYKPLENLSFEIGAVWTRWSTYSDLNMYLGAPSNYDSLNKKDWSDGWNINASVEYSPLDWLTLRAGYWHETPVTNEQYCDFMMPTNGRDAMTLGVGFKWDEMTVDLTYAHLWIYPTDYSSSTSSGVYGGSSSNVNSDIFSMSVGYSF